MTGDDNIRDVEPEILTPEEVEKAQQHSDAVMAEVVQGDQKGSTEHSETKKTADAAVNIGSRAELFHDPDDVSYATIPINGHFETCPLKSRSFKGWLTREYYLRMKTAPSSGRASVNPG